MVKCWAKTLGDCSNVQSREHYLSQGLWQGSTITVKGLWDEERTIGLSSLTTKTLCTTHNHALSPLDSEAKRLFQAIAEIYRLQEVRLKLKPSKFWTVKRYEANGSLFERWAAKFLVGFFYVVGKNERWHVTQTGPIDPPRELVEAIYGRRPFQSPEGLHLAYEVGDRHYNEDGVNLEPLFHPRDDGFVGANLDFKGVRFVVWLLGNGIESFNIPTSEGRVFGPDGSELMYRPRNCRFTISKVLSQVLQLEWNDGG